MMMKQGGKAKSNISRGEDIFGQGDRRTQRPHEVKVESDSADCKHGGKSWWQSCSYLLGWKRSDSGRE